MRALTRLLLPLLGLSHLAVGRLFFLAPAWAYAQMTPFGPYNAHFLADIGAFNLPLGVGLLIAAGDLRCHATLAGMAVLGDLAHVLNHLRDHDLHGPPHMTVLAPSAGGVAWERGDRTEPPAVVRTGVMPAVDFVGEFGWKPCSAAIRSSEHALTAPLRKFASKLHDRPKTFVWSSHSPYDHELPRYSGFWSPAWGVVSSKRTRYMSLANLAPDGAQGLHGCFRVDAVETPKVIHRAWWTGFP